MNIANQNLVILMVEAALLATPEGKGDMGNILCIRNIVAVSATLIKRNFLTLVLYGKIVEIMGMLYTFVLFSGIF
ncbi:MAG: hypothetical protein R6U27_10015 [Desulfobacterales bacterium]